MQNERNVHTIKVQCMSKVVLVSTTTISTNELYILQDKNYFALIESKRSDNRIVSACRRLYKSKGNRIVLGCDK